MPINSNVDSSFIDPEEFRAASVREARAKAASNVAKHVNEAIRAEGLQCLPCDKRPILDIVEKDGEFIYNTVDDCEHTLPRIRELLEPYL